jgi:hypothetical protein
MRVKGENSVEGSIPQFVHGFGSREFEISYNECQGSNHLVLVFQVLRFPSIYYPQPNTPKGIFLIWLLLVVTAYSLENSTFEQY